MTKPVGATGPSAAGLARAAGVAMIACLLAVGCGSDSSARESSPDDLAELVDIGDGRSLFLECHGSGRPTVVLISGTGNAGDVWRHAGPMDDPDDPPSENDGAVFQTTARSTRTCAYDRPDTRRDDGSPGRSSSVAQPTTTQDGAADLHALLQAADVPGPYVLVAHSLGGLVATTYARTYPDDVAGLVLVDPASQYMATTMGSQAWEQYVDAALSNASTGAETIDLDASNLAIEALPPLRPVPAVVLSSDQPWFILPFGEGGALVDYSGALLESQALLATSFGATHVTESDSAHDIYILNAPLVNEQICAVIGPATGC